MSTFEDVTDAADGVVTRNLVEEMVPFLRDPRPEIRQAAAATAVTASATKEGVALLHSCGAVKWLCRISGDVGTIAKDAVAALVNVSAEETSVAALEDMCKAGIVNRMMEAVSAEDCAPRLRDLCLQLLANVTRVQMGAEKLAQIGVAGGAKEGQYVRLLARWVSVHPAEDGLAYPVLVGGSRDDEFCTALVVLLRADSSKPERISLATRLFPGSHREADMKNWIEEARVVDRRAAVRDTAEVDEEEEKGRGPQKEGVVLDQWQHCASVLCNAARISEGRRALRVPGPKVALTEILPQLASPNPVRRWGIAGCVRNCCFEELDHPWLLHEIKVVPHLLMRLSDDGDEYDFDDKVVLDPRVWRKAEDGAPPRRREPVGCIKRDVVEALLQLCAILESRQSLRKMGVYFVIREVDKAEDDPEISQVCYNLVNFLQRDEQDKQGRIDYLKGLNDAETADAGSALQEQEKDARSNVEFLPPPGAPGTSEDRTAYLRETIAAEKVSAKRPVVEGDGGEEGAEEEPVGDEGADAMEKMLSSFDDSDDDEDAWKEK